MRLIIAASLLVFFTSQVFAQSVEVDESDATPPAQDEPSTGKGKANEYFQNRKKNVRRPSEQSSANTGATPRFMAVHVGTFFAGQAYRWSDSDENNVGKLNAGVTYRLGEWVNSMDWSIRIEYTSYDLNNGGAKKLSFSPILTFPDANSRFPLYFGGGAGAGLFIQQVRGKSPVALDWQLFAGVRFLNVIERVGLMLETGLKNHVFVTSWGQFNGVFINLGAVFAF